MITADSGFSSVSAMKFLQKLNAHVTSFFRTYGQFAGRYPLPFTAVPLLFGLLCLASIPVLGVNHGRHTSIFQSETSKARESFDIIKATWPNGTVTGKWNTPTPSVIISVLNEGSVFDSSIYKLIEQLNKRVMDRSGYEKICEKDKKGDCLLENRHLSALRYVQQNYNITYPIFRVGEESPFLLTGIIGGVVTEGDVHSSGEMPVLKARSLQLYYALDTTVDDTASQNFSDILREECMLIQESGIVTATYVTADLFISDFDAAGESVGGRLMLLVGLTFLVALVVSFRIIMTSSAVYIDPDQSALGIAEMGLLSSLLGCIFSYGFMFWFKAPFAPLFQLIPFLAIGMLGCLFAFLFCFLLSFRLFLLPDFYLLYLR